MMNRREFLQTGSACGLLLLKPSTAFSYQANSAVRLGLLGCGLGELGPALREQALREMPPQRNILGRKANSLPQRFKSTI